MKLKSFLKALSASLAVMSLLWGLSFYYACQPISADLSPKAPQTPLVTQLLLNIYQDNESIAFLLFKFREDEIVISVLPPEIMAEDGGKLQALNTIYKKDGLKYCAEALNNTYSTDIKRSVSLSTSQLADFLDFFGCCDLTLNEPILLQDKSIVIEKGRRLLNGEKLALILSQNKNSLNKYEVFGNAISKLFNQNYSPLTKKDSERLFNLLANGNESNLSVIDFLEAEKSSLFTQRPPTVFFAVRGRFCEKSKLFFPSKI